MERRASLERRDPQIFHALGITLIFIIQARLSNHAGRSRQRPVGIEPQVKRGDDPVGAGAGIDLAIGAGLNLAGNRVTDAGKRGGIDDRRARGEALRLAWLVAQPFQEIIAQGGALGMRLAAVPARRRRFEGRWIGQRGRRGQAWRARAAPARRRASRARAARRLRARPVPARLMARAG